MEPRGFILLADDEESFAKSTAALLKREGFQCDMAPDAFQAREMLSAKAYDLLISDIHMPGNPDLELVRQLPEPNRTIPVILVTGYPNMNTALQAFQLLVLAYLVKPLDFPELLNKVEQGVAYSRVRNAVHSSMERLQSCVSEIQQMENSIRSTPGSFSQMSLAHLGTLVLGNVARTLSDLQELFKILAHSGPNPETCTLEICPRLRAYESTLRSGVSTLERTKNLFKSKELAELRQQLERLVDRPDHP